MAAATASPAARVVHWNSTYRIFDSPRDVAITRFDVYTKSDVRLGGKRGFVQLKQGPAYFFTTSPLLTLTDIKTTKAQNIYSESVAWFSQGACLQLDLAHGTTNASVIVVSSGEIEQHFNDADAADAGCVEGISRVGYDALHNNPVDYEVTGSCSNTLGGPGGASDFDDLDMPIRPLRKHYHSRGALYYTASGTSNYDEGVEGLRSGELRFVQQGVYYGPETMSDDAYVMSFHEPDPSGRRTSNSSTPTGYTPCAFACLDDPATTGKPTMKCAVPSVTKL